jgi:transposase-like protein
VKEKVTGNFLTREDLEEAVRRMREDGSTITQIAGSVGVSISTVQNILVPNGRGEKKAKPKAKADKEQVTILPETKATVTTAVTMGAPETAGSMNPDCPECGYTMNPIDKHTHWCPSCGTMMQVLITTPWKEYPKEMR